MIELRNQKLEIVARLEALRSLRVDYARDVAATIRPPKALSDIDRRITGTEHRLEIAVADLAKAEEQEGCERAVREAEAKRMAEIEALELFIQWYALSLETEERRLLWCEARARVPGGLAEMPLMSDEAVAEWAADKLVELSGTGTVEIEQLELAEANVEEG